MEETIKLKLIETENLKCLVCKQYQVVSPLFRCDWDYQCRNCGAKFKEET